MGDNEEKDSWYEPRKLSGTKPPKSRGYVSLIPKKQNKRKNEWDEGAERQKTKKKVKTTKSEKHKESKDTVTVKVTRKKEKRESTKKKKKVVSKKSGNTSKDGSKPPKGGKFVCQVYLLLTQVAQKIAMFDIKSLSDMNFDGVPTIDINKMDVRYQSKYIQSKTITIGKDTYLNPYYLLWASMAGLLSKWMEKAIVHSGACKLDDKKVNSALRDSFGENEKKLRTSPKSIIDSMKKLSFLVYKKGSVSNSSPPQPQKSELSKVLREWFGEHNNKSLCEKYKILNIFKAWVESAGDKQASNRYLLQADILKLIKGKDGTGLMGNVDDSILAPFAPSGKDMSSGNLSIVGLLDMWLKLPVVNKLKLAWMGLQNGLIQYSIMNVKELQPLMRRSQYHYLMIGFENFKVEGVKHLRLPPSITKGWKTEA